MVRHVGCVCHWFRFGVLRYRFGRGLLRADRGSVHGVVTEADIGYVIVEVFEFGVDGGAFGALVGGSEVYHHVLISVDALCELLATQGAGKFPNVLMQLHVPIQV